MQYYPPMLHVLLKLSFQNVGVLVGRYYNTDPR